MTTRQASGTVLALAGGLGLMLTILGVLGGTVALLPFALLGLLLLVIGIVLIATPGRRPRRRAGGHSGGGYSDGGYYAHSGGVGWYAENDRGHDDHGRGSSGGYDSGSSSDSGWSGGGGWSGGDSGGGSSGGDSGGGGGGGGGGD